MLRTSWLSKRVFLIGVATFVLALTKTASLHAGSDNFASGNDAKWTQADLLGVGTWSFPGGNTYRIQAGASPLPGLLGPGRAGSIFDGGSYGNARIGVDLVAWNDALDQSFGIVARTKEPGLGTFDGYALVYSPVNDVIAISRLDNEIPTLLGTTGVVLNPANDYRLIFSTVGDSLTGDVYDLTNLATSLATVAATDATYSSGDAGLFLTDISVSFNQTADATFDNFFAVVPEPSAFVLTFLGLITLTARRGRRRLIGCPPCPPTSYR